MALCTRPAAGYTCIDVPTTMIKSASEEDEDIEKLSDIFNSFLKEEQFEEFEMTPMPKKKLHIKNLHTFSEGGMTNTANISYSNQVKIQTFLE